MPEKAEAFVIWHLPDVFQDNRQIPDLMQNESKVIERFLAHFYLIASNCLCFGNFNWKFSLFLLNYKLSYTYTVTKIDCTCISVPSLQTLLSCCRITNGANQRRFWPMTNSDLAAEMFRAEFGDDTIF